VSGGQRGIDRLLAVMRRLRDPERGCPWDIEQSFATIAPYTIEEAYEVADTIAREDWNALPGELGDLLLQVVYYTQMGTEQGRFDFNTVAHGIADKMIERHPHVFGAEEVAGSAALKTIWEEHKAAERASKGMDPSVLADVPVGFPGLTRALKLQKRAARVGFDWGAAAPILGKVKEEIAELEDAIDRDLPPEERALELGDLLFTIVNLARHLDVDPEAALRAANGKFERRFRGMEAAAAAAGRQMAEMTLDEQEALWVEAKAAEGGA
jgi:MazG family protein